VAGVELRGIVRTQPDGTVALDHLDLAVPSGEVLALLGPSGSGKTSVLRVIAGLDRPAAGQVLLDGRDITTDEPADRQVALVPQAGGLPPHLDVAGNLALPLELRHVARRETRVLVGVQSRLWGLTHLLRRRAPTLSAGEYQQVSVGRATIRRPRVLLLDEPLARIDAQRRAHLRRGLCEQIRGQGVTTIWVTNDPEEALAVGDHVAVLHNGAVTQHGTPTEIYERPATAAVADLVGSPGVNLLAGTIEVGSQTVWVRLTDGAMAVPGLAPGAARHLDQRDVLAGVRPQHLRPDREGPLRLQITHAARLGDRLRLVGGIAGTTVTADCPPDTAAAPGEALACTATAVHLFDVDERELWHPGDPAPARRSG
jgi:ABC-type sugar transport system ATPase subunit